jgi:hypothetical protein
VARAQTPPEGLRACARMSDPGERLRCYDTQMAGMGVVVASPIAAVAPAPAPAPPAIAVAPSTATAPGAVASGVAAPPPATAAAASSAPAAAAAVPEAAVSGEQKFGAIDLPRTAREKVDKPDNVLLSTIASIRQIRPKLWLIVLANGQTWLQDGTQITMFFRAGYDVRIEKGLLEGDFRMSTTQTGAKNWVRVSRVQ